MVKDDDSVCYLNLVISDGLAPFNAENLWSPKIHQTDPAAAGPLQSSPFVHIAAAPSYPSPSTSTGTAVYRPIVPTLNESRAGTSSGHSGPGPRSSPNRDAGVEQDADSLGGINNHTQGTEFYGAMGTFSFLSRLRSRALSEADLESSAQFHGHRGSRNLDDISIVNLLHSSDYPVEMEYDRRKSHMTPMLSAVRGQGAEPMAQASMTAVASGSRSYATSAQAMEIEKESARLYFQNLHNIHPILDPSAFLARCEKEVWSRAPFANSSVDLQRGCRRFLSLYYAVLAIGAITAGEQSLLAWRQNLDFLDQDEISSGIQASPTTYPPIRLARLYFERSKAHLGDVFESCSFESAQTLFLMSVFCQNALKPHSCYMYNGMATRAALAMGVADKKGANAESAGLLWWGLYSHEIEMCASAGRESALGDPSRYKIPLPRGPTANSGRDLIYCMVSLAQLLNHLNTDVYHLQGEGSLPQKSKKSQELDSRLVQWRDNLPASLDLRGSSLKEPEHITKQKIVVKLRESTPCPGFARS